MRHLVQMVVLAVIISFVCTACASVNEAQKRRARSLSIAQMEKQDVSIDEAIAGLEVVPEGETKDQESIRIKALNILKAEKSKREQAELLKSSNPVVAQAMRELAEEKENADKTVKRNARVWKEMAPVGCMPTLVNSAAAKFSRFKKVVTVRVSNDSKNVVNITSASRGMGEVVLGLTPNCSISLGFAMGAPDDENIVLLAEPKGGGYSQPFQVHLYRSSLSDNRRESYVWQIN